MAVAKICDRCGITFKPPFICTRKYFVQKSSVVTCVAVDLCGECYKEFCDWLEKTEEEAEQALKEREDNVQSERRLC